MRLLIYLITMTGVATPVFAETPASFLATYASQARQENPSFNVPSASRGQQFFKESHGKEWSCASCHTQTPTSSGKHQVTGKRIEPLAPAANAERFTSERKVEKWFKRNCGDVLGRNCTAQEKGDVLAYLLSMR